MTSSYYQQLVNIIGYSPDLLFLTRQSLDSPKGYQEALERWNELLANSPVCMIYLKQKSSITFTRALPEPFLVGVSIAILLADLPISVFSLEDGLIDPTQLTEKHLVAADESLDLNDYYSSLKDLTVVLCYREDYLLSGLNILSWYGILSAFDWVNQPIPDNFLKAAYLISDSGDLVEISLD